MKSYFNRGKSLNTRYAHIFNPLKEKSHFSGGVFHIGAMSSNS